MILTLTVPGVCQGAPAQVGAPTDLQPIGVPASEIPRWVCNYYSLQRFPWYPPLPFNWLGDETNIVLYVSPSYTNAIFVGDLDVDYAQRAAQAEVLRLVNQAAEGPPPLPDGGGGTNYDSGGGGSWPQRVYATNDFWLEAVSVASNLFNVVLHGTTNGSTYLITSTESLNQPTNCAWLVEGSLQGGPGDATPSPWALRSEPIAFSSAPKPATSAPPPPCHSGGN